MTSQPHARIHAMMPERDTQLWEPKKPFEKDIRRMFPAVQADWILGKVSKLWWVQDFRRQEHENAALLARLEAVERCDCVPAAISSKSCRKCGRRATITHEHFMRILADAHKTAAVERERDELEDKLFRKIVQKQAVERERDTMREDFIDVCERAGLAWEDGNREVMSEALAIIMVKAASAAAPPDEPITGGLLHQETRQEMGVDAPDFGPLIGAPPSRETRG